MFYGNVKKGETTWNNSGSFSKPKRIVNSQAGRECAVSQIYLSKEPFSFRTTVSQDASLENFAVRCNFKVNKLFFFCSFLFSLSLSFKARRPELIHTNESRILGKLDVLASNAAALSKGFWNSFSVIVSRKQDTVPWIPSLMAKVDPLRGHLILGTKPCKVKPSDSCSRGSRQKWLKWGRGFKPWLCHLWGVGHWGSYLTLLGLRASSAKWS